MIPDLKKLTETQATILAAVFALTNMGQPAPAVAIVARMVTSSRPLSLSSAVMTICCDYMETDEHQQMFEDEAYGWVKDLRKLSIAEIVKTWPDTAKYMTAMGVVQ